MLTLIIYLATFLSFAAVLGVDGRPNIPVTIIVNNPSATVNDQLRQRYLFTNSVNDINPQSGAVTPSAVAVSSGIIVNSNNGGAPLASSGTLEGVPIHIVRQNDQREADILYQLENQEALAQGKRVALVNNGANDAKAADKAVLNNEALLLALQSGNFSLIQQFQKPQAASITTIVGNQRPQLVVVRPQNDYVDQKAVLLQKQQHPKVIVMPANVKAVGEVHAIQRGSRPSSFLASATSDDLLDLQRQRAKEDDQRLMHPHDSIVLIKSSTPVPPGEIDVTTASLSPSESFFLLHGGLFASTKAPTSTTNGGKENDVPLDLLYLQKQRERNAQQGRVGKPERIVLLSPVATTPAILTSTARAAEVTMTPTTTAVAVTTTATAASVPQTTTDTHNDALQAFDAAAAQRAIANQALDRRPPSATTPSSNTTTEDLSAATAATVAVEDNNNNKTTSSTSTTRAPSTQRQARIVLDAPAIESPEEAAQRLRGQSNEVFYRSRPPPLLRTTTPSPVTDATISAENQPGPK